MRSGGTALSLLASPLNVYILKALQERDLPLIELSQAIGLPPASTLRTYLRELVEVEVLERRQEPGFPGSVSYAVTPVGLKLLAVGEVLQRWLGKAPGGPVVLGSSAAKSTVKALVDGWSAAIIRALAVRPLALTELSRLIPQISYPTLERKLTAMRLVGLLRPEPNRSGRGTPYGVTRWLREAVPSLAAAVAWEQRYVSEGMPQLGRFDIEAGFLLALPLIELPPEVAGVCRLSLEVRKGGELDYAGVTVTLEEGRLISCTTRSDGSVDAWASGSALGWFRWVNGSGDGQLELGGRTSVAWSLVTALRDTLIPLVQKTS